MATAPANRYREAGSMESAASWLGRLPLGAAARKPLRRLYHAALYLGTFGRGLRCDLPSGETIFVSPAYRYMTWNETEYDAFRCAVTPGAIALDIGANVGAYSLLLGGWVGAGGRVFAFEPSPAAYDGLCKHLRLNGLDEIVTAIAAAVGAETTTLPFVVAPTAGEGHLAEPSDVESATVPAPVTTVDAFCAREGITPDFIKVDVEGAELDVLRGARVTIDRTRGRLALFVELHPSRWASRGISRGDLEREFDRLGLSVVPPVADVDPWTLEGIAVRLVAR